MQEFWDVVQQSITGPGRFRFIVQPTIAVLLGIRDGRRDARTGDVPAAFGLLFAHGKRIERLQSVLATILIPMLVGTALDLLFVFIILREIRPLSSLLVGVMLLGLPYLASRGLSNRITVYRARRAVRARQGKSS